MRHSPHNQECNSGDLSVTSPADRRRGSPPSAPAWSFRAVAVGSILQFIDGRREVLHANAQAFSAVGG